MLRWKRLHSTITAFTREEVKFTVTGIKLTLPEIPKDLSVESPDGLNVGNEGQNGNRWQQDSVCNTDINVFFHCLCSVSLGQFDLCTFYNYSEIKLKAYRISWSYYPL